MTYNDLAKKYFSGAQINQLLKLNQIGYDLSYLTPGISCDLLREIYDILSEDSSYKTKSNVTYIESLIDQGYDFTKINDYAKYCKYPNFQYIVYAIENRLDPSPLLIEGLSDATSYFIYEGMKIGKDLSHLAHSDISSSKMKVLLDAYKDGIDLSEYKDFGIDEFREIYSLYRYKKYGIPINPDDFIDPSYDFKYMEALFGADRCGLDINILKDNNVSTEKIKALIENYPVSYLEDVINPVLDVEAMKELIHFQNKVYLIDHNVKRVKEFTDAVIKDGSSKMDVDILANAYIKKMNLNLFIGQDFTSKLAMFQYCKKHWDRKIKIEDYLDLSTKEKIMINNILLYKPRSFSKVDLSKPIEDQYSSIMYKKQKDNSFPCCPYNKNELIDQLDNLCLKTENGDLIQIQYDNTTDKDPIEILPDPFIHYTKNSVDIVNSFLFDNVDALLDIAKKEVYITREGEWLYLVSLRDDKTLFITENIDIEDIDNLDTKLIDLMFNQYLKEEDFISFLDVNNVDKYGIDNLSSYVYFTNVFDGFAYITKNDIKNKYSAIDKKTIKKAIEDFDKDIKSITKLKFHCGVYKKKGDSYSLSQVLTKDDVSTSSDLFDYLKREVGEYSIDRSNKNIVFNKGDDDIDR